MTYLHVKKGMLFAVLLAPMTAMPSAQHGAGDNSARNCEQQGQHGATGQCQCGQGDKMAKAHCDGHNAKMKGVGHDHGAMTHAPATVKKTFQQKNDAAMVDMHNGMAAVKFSDNDDVDFMTLMIPHHEGAIKMAEIILATSTDVEVRNLAQGIITEQKNEIKIMNHLIEARNK